VTVIAFLRWLFVKPAVNEILDYDLNEAQRDRLKHVKAAEEHSAWVQMLDQRIARIQAERPQITPPNHYITK
jgi:hypothetical protein